MVGPEQQNIYLAQGLKRAGLPSLFLCAADPCKVRSEQDETAENRGKGQPPLVAYQVEPVTTAWIFVPGNPGI